MCWKNAYPRKKRAMSYCQRTTAVTTVRTAYIAYQKSVKLTIYTYCKGERFAGLNFRGFQEYRESFPVNISAAL